MIDNVSKKICYVSDDDSKINYFLSANNVPYQIDYLPTSLLLDFIQSTSLYLINIDLIKSWETNVPHKKLYLPERNLFIPNDFQLCERDTYDGNVPCIIHDSPLSRLWFKQDDEYLLPKACLNFEIMSPLAYLDPSHAALNCLFVRLLNDELNEFLYPAVLGGMAYSISNTKYGINIAIGGYHDKQKELLEKICTHLTKYKVDVERFKIIKEAYERGLKNFKMEQPYSHARYFNNLLLAERIWTNDELLQSVEDMESSKIQPFLLM